MKLEALNEDREETPRQPLVLFIPRHLAAACADCLGYFYVVGRETCPGCGSTQWVHAEKIDRERSVAPVDGKLSAV